MSLKNILLIVLTLLASATTQAGDFEMRIGPNLSPMIILPGVIDRIPETHQTATSTFPNGNLLIVQQDFAHPNGNARIPGGVYLIRKGETRATRILDETYFKVVSILKSDRSSYHQTEGVVDTNSGEFFAKTGGPKLLTSNSATYFAFSDGTVQALTHHPGAGVTYNFDFVDVQGNRYFIITVHEFGKPSGPSAHGRGGYYILSATHQKLIFLGTYEGNQTTITTEIVADTQIFLPKLNLMIDVDLFDTHELPEAKPPGESHPHFHPFVLTHALDEKLPTPQPRLSDNLLRSNHSYLLMAGMDPCDLLLSGLQPNSAMSLIKMAEAIARIETGLSPRSFQQLQSLKTAFAQITITDPQVIKTSRALLMEGANPRFEKEMQREMIQLWRNQLDGRTSKEVEDAANAAMSRYSN